MWRWPRLEARARVSDPWDWLHCEAAGCSWLVLHTAAGCTVPRCTRAAQDAMCALHAPPHAARCAAGRDLAVVLLHAIAYHDTGPGATDAAVGGGAGNTHVTASTRGKCAKPQLPVPG